MLQLSKAKSILYHLYPGFIITLCFVVLAKWLNKYHLPPQISLLISIAVAALPIFLVHLNKAKSKEHKKSINELNGYQYRLPPGKLILYVSCLVIFMFLVWGATQPLNKIITEKFLSWLPSWYLNQDFNGYSKNIVLFTLVFNLLLNGILSPVLEEYYFRGYLLSRMDVWGKWSFAINSMLFSLYHFWQPYIYLTLFISLLPLSWAVWKTRDLRVGIYTHCIINILGALASFGLLIK